MKSKHWGTLLLDEGGDGHAEIVRRDLDDAKIQSRICHVTDGQGALDSQRLTFGFADPSSHPHSRPNLLEVPLPCVDRLEVLVRSKVDSPLRHMIAVILSFSGVDFNLRSFSSLGASISLTKPLDFHAFTRPSCTVDAYWRLRNRFRQSLQDESKTAEGGL